MEKITVLLVEDEQTLAMIIKDTLEGQNFIIHTAADGEEGLRKFFDLRPDVLVADVMMPRYCSLPPAPPSTMWWKGLSWVPTTT